MEAHQPAQAEDEAQTGRTFDEVAPVDEHAPSQPLGAADRAIAAAFFVLVAAMYVAWAVGIFFLLRALFSLLKIT